MRSGVRYTVATAAVALLVALAGAALTTGGERVGVWIGVAVGFAVQVGGFWLLFVGLFPSRPGVAHGVGVLGRFLVVAMVALMWVPLLGVAAAPTLFALVAVLFGSTLLEPLFFPTASETRR